MAIKINTFLSLKFDNFALFGNSSAGRLFLLKHYHNFCILDCIRANQTQLQLGSSGQSFREQELQPPFGRFIADKKSSQWVVRRKSNWEQWHMLIADITNLGDPFSLHRLFHSRLPRVEGEAETRLVPIMNHLTPTVNRLAKIGESYSWKEEVATVAVVVATMWLLRSHC